MLDFVTDIFIIDTKGCSLKYLTIVQGVDREGK